MPASLIYEGATAILRAPYDPEFIAELKDRIPASFRSWDADRKVWRIESPYDREAARLAEQWFPGSSLAARPAARTHTNCQCTADHKALGICATAPMVVVTAAYRAMAKVTHPDVGGDAESMRRLNDAYERIVSGMQEK